jgi:hypothetical protein
MTAAPKRVIKYMYWKLDSKGQPNPDFTESPHLFPHAHCYAIPVPEDVQACCEEFADPPECLLLDKFGRTKGECKRQ